MADLTTKTNIDQIELKADQDTGQIAYLFIQYANLYLADGVVVARQTSRESMGATDPAAAAILGDAFASALVTIQDLRGQLAAAQAALAAKP